MTLTDRRLRPLAIAMMKEQLLRQSVIHVDETPMPLQREKRVVKPRQWVYSGRVRKITLYGLTDDTQGEHVRSFRPMSELYWADADANELETGYILTFPSRQECVEGRLDG